MTKAWERGVIHSENFRAWITHVHLMSGKITNVFERMSGLGPQLYWKSLWHRCFPVNFEKFFTEHLRTTASKNLRNAAISTSPIPVSPA